MADVRPPTRTPGEPVSQGVFPAGAAYLPPSQSTPASEPVSGVPVSAPAGSVMPGPEPLPQRIPGPPDVPDVPGADEPDDPYVHPAERERLGGSELAKIATHLRYDEDLEEQTTEPPPGFDVNEVRAAVKQVPGVRDAQLRPNPGGVHTLRLDLEEGADAAEVSRRVARLLKQKMGLAAEPRRSSATAAATTAAATTAAATAAAAPARGGAAAAAQPVAAPAARGLMPADPPNLGARLDERARQRHAPAPGRSREAEGENGPVRAGTSPRLVLDQVQVRTLGLDATVEVRLTSRGAPAIGVASGPAVDGYMLRLSAVAAANAVDQLLAKVESGDQAGRCWVEHASVVPFGSCEVAVVVVLMVCGGVVEQLSGSAVVAGDPRQAVVRATLSSVNRRLDALLG
jgi:hypothetical protein